MASESKRKRLSKADLKRLQAEKSKKAVEKRGRGLGSRQDFVLPAKWETEVREFATNTSLTYISPGKTCYGKQQEVKKVLGERGMELCFVRDESDGTDEGASSSEEYCSDFAKAGTSTSTAKTTSEVERRLFVCESTQITKLIEDINRTSKCSTPDCSGEYVNLMKFIEFSIPFYPFFLYSLFLILILHMFLNETCFIFSLGHSYLVSY